jgi:hypothetical protein
MIFHFFGKEDIIVLDANTSKVSKDLVVAPVIRTMKQHSAMNSA